MDNNTKTVLFHGDSITDCGRGRENLANLGGGYPMMAAAWYSAMYPEEGVRFANKGVGGFRVRDLKACWEEDYVALKPDLVSILIGINDTWRRYDNNDPTTAEAFEADYRDILTRTRKVTPDGPIVMMEPFVLPVPDDRKQWREDLDPKIHVVRTLAREFGATLIPLDGIFAAAAARRDPAFWAGDGVHPTPAGHALIAQSWLDTVEALGLL